MTTVKNIAVTDKDVKHLVKVIGEVGEPVEIDFLASNIRERIIKARKIDFAERLIKVYDPTNDLEVGDHIFRHFAKVRTSQRKSTEFNDYAEGEVYEKIRQKDADYDLVCVNWTNPLVKRQTTFLRKNGAQAYLPINYGRGAGNPTRFLGPDKSERERDDVIEQLRGDMLRSIRGVLVEKLHDRDEFLTWGPLWYLIDQLEEIDYEKILKAEQILTESDGPVASEVLVEELFSLRPDAPRFLHYRFSLNYMMENFFSEKFYCVSHFAGGAWTNRARVEKAFGCRPLRISTATVNENCRRSDFVLDASSFEDQLRTIYDGETKREADWAGPDRFSHVVTYGELVSGTLTISNPAAGFFPDDTRLSLVNGENEFEVTHHYDASFVDGLGDFYSSSGIVPGTIIDIDRTENSRVFAVDYRRSEQTFQYPELEYDPETDRARVVPGTEREVDCEIISHAFIPPADIGLLEDLRNRMRVDESAYEVLVKLFREYRASFHPLTLWNIGNVVRHMSLEQVMTMLSSYKSFYRLDDESSEEFHLSAAQVGAGSLKKRAADKSGDGAVSMEHAGRYVRPKTYVINLTESHWKVARNYTILPISSENDILDVRVNDRVVVLVGGSIQAAGIASSHKELLPAKVQSRLGDDAFFASVNVSFIGEGFCDSVELYHVSDDGLLAELDADTYNQVVDFYANASEGVSVSA